MKNQLHSKTIWVSILIGVASLLALFGVIDTESIDLSPDAAWVGVAWSVIQYILRLATKDPVKKSSNKIAVIILFTIISFGGCSAVPQNTTNQDGIVVEIGTDKLEDVVNLYYKTASYSIRYIENKENALSFALDLFYDVKNTIENFKTIQPEIDDLSDQEVIDLVVLADSYDLGEYKDYFKSACKLVLIGFQEGNKYLRKTNKETAVE